MIKTPKHVRGSTDSLRSTNTTVTSCQARAVLEIHSQGEKPTYSSSQQKSGKQPVRLQMETTPAAVVSPVKKSVSVLQRLRSRHLFGRIQTSQTPPWRRGPTPTALRSHPSSGKLRHATGEKSRPPRLPHGGPRPGEEAAPHNGKGDTGRARPAGRPPSGSAEARPAPTLGNQAFFSRSHS